LEGYAQLANLIEENYSDYRSAFRADPFLGIRMGYFLDRVFQRFLDKLVQHVHKKRPLRSAARDLKGFQKEEVNRVFANMGSGVFPNIPLPMSLAGGSPPPLPPISRPGGNPPTFGGNFGGNTKTEEVNQGAVSAWAIPPGKKYSDFFDGKKYPENLKGWPTMEHPSNGKGHQVICLKFQTQGKCNSRCGFTHFNPGTLEKSQYNKLDTKFRGINKN
jgi:hypothetical protein